MTRAENETQPATHEAPQAVDQQPWRQRRGRAHQHILGVVPWAGTQFSPSEQHSVPHRLGGVLRGR